MLLFVQSSGKYQLLKMTQIGIFNRLAIDLPNSCIIGMETFPIHVLCSDSSFLYFKITYSFLCFEEKLGSVLEFTT